MSGAPIVRTSSRAPHGHARCSRGRPGPEMNGGGTMRFARKSSPVVPAGRELPSSGSITTLNESGIRSSPRRDVLRDTDAIAVRCVRFVDSCKIRDVRNTEGKNKCYISNLCRKCIYSEQRPVLKHRSTFVSCAMLHATVLKCDNFVSVLNQAPLHLNKNFNNSCYNSLPGIHVQ